MYDERVYVYYMVIIICILYVFMSIVVDRNKICVEFEERILNV